MSTALTPAALSWITLPQAQADWDKFKRDASWFEEWPSVATIVLPGTPTHFQEGQRQGVLEVKIDDIKSLRYTEKKFEHGREDDRDTVGCIDEIKLPDGTTVATFTVGDQKSGWQWQREIDSDGIYGPITKKRLLANGEFYRHDAVGRTINTRIPTSGPAFIPVLIDPMAIGNQMWRPARDSLLAMGVGEEVTSFMENSNGGKTGWISRVPTGTKGHWQNENQTLSGGWNDYMDVEPDGSEIPCTADTLVRTYRRAAVDESDDRTRLRETITFHKQYTEEGPKVNGYWNRTGTYVLNQD